MKGNREILERLKSDLLCWEGYRPLEGATSSRIGLGEIEDAFPLQVFPKKAIHEFICTSPDHAAATDGFIAGLLSTFMAEGAACVWIATNRRLFPSALAGFGVAVERIIFIDVKNEKEVLWIMEEALRCEGLGAVVAEVDGLSLIESRRLQLAVEQGGIPGMVIRKDARRMTSNAATARWRITPQPSEDEEGIPGVGFPRWMVELLKVRNGIPGNWLLEWQGDEFVQIPQIAEQRSSLPLRNFG